MIHDVRTRGASAVCKPILSDGSCGQFIKTTESVTDRMLLDFDDPNMYRDWSDAFRELKEDEVAYVPWHADGRARPRL